VLSGSPTQMEVLSGSLAAWQPNGLSRGCAGWKHFPKAWQLKRPAIHSVLEFLLFVLCARGCEALSVSITIRGQCSTRAITAPGTTRLQI
jgi:hypothetical protein